jgi:hypothetical protein
MKGSSNVSLNVPKTCCQPYSGGSAHRDTPSPSGSPPRSYDDITSTPRELFLEFLNLIIIELKWTARILKIRA